MLGIGRYRNVLLQYFGLNGNIMSFTAIYCLVLELTILDIHTGKVALYRQATGPPYVRLLFTRCLTNLLFLTLTVV